MNALQRKIVSDYQAAAGAHDEPGIYAEPAGDPGLAYDARTAGVFDIRLPRSFRASGKHFLSVQLLVEGYSGYWYWLSARTGAPQNSPVKQRDHLAGGQWTQVTTPSGAVNCRKP